MGYKKFASEELLTMDKKYRAVFVNSLGGFKSVVLVGTCDQQGRTNLAIFNSLFQMGTNPPLCGLIFRSEGRESHTLENIMETGQYTINHIHEEILSQAHQTGATFDRGISEFEVTGLETEYHERIAAPYVQQSHLKLGMQLEQKVDLTINGTVLLIGKIVEIMIPEDCLGMDGFVDLEQAGSLTISGLDSYHTTRSVGRLGYPKK